MKLTNKKRNDKKKRTDYLVRYFQEYAAKEYKKEHTEPQVPEEKTTGERAWKVIDKIFFWVILVILVGLSI